VCCVAAYMHRLYCAVLCCAVYAVASQNCIVLLRRKSCCVCSPERVDVLLHVDFQFKGGIRLLKAEVLNRMYIPSKEQMMSFVETREVRFVHFSAGRSCGISQWA
jgi:hypothetical protein